MAIRMEHLGPDRKLTRMEMTQMLARSMNMTGKKRGNSPFSDVSEYLLGCGDSETNVGGWLDQRLFGRHLHADEQATRAEFVTLLAKVMNR